MLLSATGYVFRLLLGVIFMLITLFFVYKDGAHILGQLDIVGDRILPGRWRRFSRVVPATIISTATEIGRGHVCTPVTNAPPVCRLLLEKKQCTVLLCSYSIACKTQQ